MQLATAVRHRSRSRSWRVAVIVVVALLAGAAAFAVSGSRWQSQAVVTVVPPQTGPDSTIDENPLLRLDDNLPQLLTVLATSMHTSAASSALRQQGGAGSFTVSTGNQDTALAVNRAVLQFTAESSSADLARHTSAALVSVARDQLYRLQTRTDVPGAARATIEVVAAPTPAVRHLDARWTAAGRAALIVVTLLGGAWFVAARRRRRTGAASASA